MHWSQVATLHKPPVTIHDHKDKMDVYILENIIYNLGPIEAALRSTWQGSRRLSFYQVCSTLKIHNFSSNYQRSITGLLFYRSLISFALRKKFGKEPQSSARDHDLILVREFVSHEKGLKRSLWSSYGTVMLTCVPDNRHHNFMLNYGGISEMNF